MWVKETARRDVKVKEKGDNERKKINEAVLKLWHYISSNIYKLK